ncbi:MAG TPA: NUDIX domain-containing protein [Phycicoccus sp.]|nr:NUDIX domain-containing protein [Phycicoccus sp.]
MGYPPFAVTVDLVVLTIRAGHLSVLLIERGEDPYAGRWALPGGFVHVDEDVRDAAYRELREETGVVTGIHLEQLATYGAPDRDPRMRTVSVAWLALAPDLHEPVAGSDAAGAAWVPVVDAVRHRLAFDHAEILRDAIARARAKLEYTSLATAFCPPEFTVAQLRAVYEAVWGQQLDARNFHRKVTGAAGFLEPTGRLTNVDGGRPAQLFRPGPALLLDPPFTR